jgi:hypothetical protein
MIVVIVKPDNHGRVFREFDQQRIQAPETMVPEHVDLVEEDPGLIELRVARGKEAVPEERNLLLQRACGRDHAIQPGGSCGVKLAELRLVYVVATDDVLRHDLWITGVKQFLEHRLIAFCDSGFEFITRRTKPGAAQQMRHECHVLLMHTSVSFRTRLVGGGDDFRPVVLGC